MPNAKMKLVFHQQEITSDKQLEIWIEEDADRILHLEYYSSWH